MSQPRRHRFTAWDGSQDPGLDPDAIMKALADDLIEPFRPLLDAYVLHHFSGEDEEYLQPIHKARLVNILHEDITVQEEAKATHRSTLLVAAETAVVSLSQSLSKGADLHLPLFEPPRKSESIDE